MTRPLTDAEVMDSVTSEFGQFIIAMRSFHREGRTYREAVDTFRRIIAIETLFDDDETERVDILRVFEASVKRFEESVRQSRAIAEWVFGDDSPALQYRHPQTGDGLDEDGAIL